MKKNNLCLIPRHLLILIEKIPNAMKLTFLFLVISLLTFTAKASAQRVSISLNNVKVEKILSTITKQTGLSVAYSKQIVNLDRRMSIQVEDADVAQVLEKLVADTNLSYTCLRNVLKHQLRQYYSKRSRFPELLQTPKANRSLVLMLSSKVPQQVRSRISTVILTSKYPTVPYYRFHTSDINHLKFLSTTRIYLPFS